MKDVKAYYSNYERTHVKIKQAISEICKENGKLSVRKISEKAGIGVTTAYEHGCRHMIKRVMTAGQEDVDLVLEEVDYVTNEEIQNWADKLCKRYELPKCHVMVFVEMDECIEIIGECDGGCMVFFEMFNPSRFCIGVEKDTLKNRQFVYETLQKHLLDYKKLIDKK